MTNIETVSEHQDTEQAVRQLARQMAGRRLPSERDLAARLHVSRPRLRAVLADLRAEGLIEPRPGSGTYAVAPDGHSLRRVALLIDEGLKLGDDPFFSHLLECLLTALQAAGARCLIERVDGRGGPPTLEDGALTLGLAGRSLIERQRPDDPPMVGLLLPPETPPGRRASVFGLEDRAAGRAAGESLLARGCRDIVFVGRRDIPASRERWAGVAEAVMAQGARPHFRDSPLNYSAGLALGRGLPLPGGDGPLGVVAANDWLAVGLHAGLLRHESPRAHDIPLVSFDGLPLAADPALGIRSLAVPIEAIAEDAVAELRRLGRSPASVGRAVFYPLHWTP
ncbi:MAG: GntR family transcriptional regulator [Armatimonadetes bacterium]|nr:GntR family transcriptional regulator [Armatimonadota bacterium]